MSNLVEIHTILVVLIMFAAALTRSTFGFGEALIAVPLLALSGVDIKVAAAVVGLTSTVNAFAILLTDWRSVQWGDSWRLMLSTLVGVPAGVIALVHVPADVVKLVLAAVVIGFSLYSLAGSCLWQFRSDRFAFFFGFLAGLLGGAYGTLGPPLVIFGTLRGWPARQFRTTLQSIFLPASLFVAFNHYTLQLWTGEVFGYFGVSVPFILLATPLGKWFHQRIPAAQFARLIYQLLLLMGVALLASLIA